MSDLSKPWPFGLDGPRWWLPVVVALAAIAAALTIDHPVSLWAQAWPPAARQVLRAITPYGESGWVLYPSGVLFAAAIIAALLARRPLQRLLFRQAATLWAFVFLGVGLPSLTTTLIKRAVGRGRPVHFDQTGLFGTRPNWVDWTYQSFPSGHATTAFAAAMVVALLWPRWFWPALAFAVLIALSRLSEGVHYPSDVVAGAVVGVLGAYCTRWLFARRGWLFRAKPDGDIVRRPFASLWRAMALRRRGSAPMPQPDRP